MAKFIHTKPQKIMMLLRRICKALGNLYFSHVLRSDAQAGRIYKCKMSNSYVGITVDSGHRKLNVTPVDAIEPVAPSRLFSSPDTVIAFVGETVSLRCFFSGFPSPRISWFRQEGSRPPGQYRIMNFKTRLMIQDVQQSDEGPYICRASNRVSKLDHVIYVDVEAFPVFRSMKDRPHNINVTDGDSVTVTCNAYAEPIAEITWYINGDSVNAENLPPRCHIVSNDTVLTISNVCRDCPDGTSDIRVIQCRASNEHGAVYGAGYINILKKTVIQVAPTNVTVTFADSVASFNCKGTSDDSTPITTKWYQYLNEMKRFVPVLEIPLEVVVESNGSLSFSLLHSGSSWAEHEGLYKCIVSNGYSLQTGNAWLRFRNEMFHRILLSGNNCSHSSASFVVCILLLLVACNKN